MLALLESQAFEDRMTAYEAANGTAIKAQGRYKRWGWLALALATLATLIAAATLLPVSAMFPEHSTRIVSGLQSVANILSLAIVWWLNQIGAIDEWMTTRAEAERLRGTLFSDLLAAPPPPGARADQLWPEKLALFGGAHVDYQRRYFASAERRHMKGARSLSLPRWLAFSAIALAIVVGALTFFDLWPVEVLKQAPWLRLNDEPIRWQLGLNTMAASLLAYASARTMMNQDERNVALYRHSGRRLDELKATEGAEVEAAARNGDGDRVLKYALAAQSILEADHQAWRLHRPLANPPGVDL